MDRYRAIEGFALCLLCFNFKLINSAAPVFSNIVVPLQVREDVTSEMLVGTLNVTDPDGGSVTSCTHTGDSGEFDIRQDNTDNTRFELYVLAGAAFEYDNTSSFTLVVTCTDTQSETANENIMIDVIPNQPPTISAASYPLSVSENFVTQTLLYTLTVSDVENDAIFCDVRQTVPAMSKFGILWNSISAEYQLFLLSNPGLNYSSTPIYTVTVECWDNYGTSDSDVVVYVLPNAAPIFTNLPADQSVDASSTSMGATVFTVSASDNDSSTLTYTMTSYPVSQDLFVLDAISGVVEATKDLTFAQDSAYLLTVTASDTITTATENLRILLSNTNTAPTIDNLPAVVYTDEDINGNSVIFTVDSNDPDISDTLTLTFTVTPAAYASKFFIHQGGKQLRTQSGETLDYEDQSVLEIQFSVTDGKATNGPYNLTVYVNDVSAACTFSASMYYVTMYEGDAVNSSADPGLVVTDDDTGDSYALAIDYTASTDSTYFSINATSGIITFATNYDVDNTHPTDVNLTIVCTDLYGKSGTSTVSVTVLDVNDNAPQFGKAGYISYIDQYDEPTMTIVKVKQINAFCSDADSGVNADIEYSWTELTIGSSSYFHMSTTGEVILLTYPAISMTYGDMHSFIITGTDQGSPPLSDTTRLDIIYKYTNISANITIPTTIAPTTNSAEASFWKETINIIVVVLAVAVGALLAGMALYLCMKWCRNPIHKRSPNPFLQRKVAPKPAPTKVPFEFWGPDREIGGVTHMHNAVPAPSL